MSLVTILLSNNVSMLAGQLMLARRNGFITSASSSYVDVKNTKQFEMTSLKSPK